MERGTFRRRIGEHELVRRGRLAATAPRQMSRKIPACHRPSAAADRLGRSGRLLNF